MSSMALVHVVQDDPVRRRRPRWLRALMGLGAAGLGCAGALMLPAGMFSAAVAGGTGWHARPGQGAGRFQDALAVGQEAELPLYPCRATINRDVHLGRVRPDFGGCHIGFDGKEVEIAPYETLGVVWRATGEAPFAAGYETVARPDSGFDTVALYPCRAPYQDGIHSGQARAGEKACSFGFGGRRITIPTGDLLQSAPWLAWARATARNLPDVAVASGSEGGEPFYVCRAADKDGLRPGKIKRSSGGCSIVSEGRELSAERFEVLVSRWVVGRAGTVPVSAVAAGREGGRPQYVCRAQTRDGIQVGKVSEALGGCHVGMLGREAVVSDYEVLSQ